jgi:hypothetical protein
VGERCSTSNRLDLALADGENIFRRAAVENGEWGMGSLKT